MGEYATLTGIQMPLDPPPVDVESLAPPEWMALLDAAAGVVEGAEVLEFAAGWWPWDQINVQRETLLAATQACIAARVSYKLGAKVQATAKPGERGFRQVDCSGFVRWSLAKSANFTEFYRCGGSVEQREWIEKQRFKVSTTAACRLKDGGVRIVFLPPGASAGGIGHVALVYDGWTMEAYGSAGVGRREWGSCSWMYSPALRVYVLSPPVGEAARRAAAGVRAEAVR
jgi:hypothetical protein